MQGRHQQKDEQQEEEEEECEPFCARNNNGNEEESESWTTTTQKSANNNNNQNRNGFLLKNNAMMMMMIKPAAVAAQQQQQQQQPSSSSSSSYLISNGHHSTNRATNRSTTSTTTRMQEETTAVQQQQQDHQQSSSLRIMAAEYAFLCLLHVICLSVYIIPVLLTRLPVEYASTTSTNTASARRSGSIVSSPVLDELHIMSPENLDIHGHSGKTLLEILQIVFTNDYWGRPMNSPSSHKSWRPLTVLSFRWFQQAWNGGSNSSSSSSNALLGHRLVNIVTHAAAAELVAILAIKLFLPTHHHQNSNNNNNTDYLRRQRPQQQQQQQRYYYQQRNKRLLLHALCKILFTLHPTHVEVVANAANRPHLLAVLLALVLCDPDCSIVLYIVCLVAGFLSAETFIFTIPASLVTLSAIVYQRMYHNDYRREQKILHHHHQSLQFLNHEQHREQLDSNATGGGAPPSSLSLQPKTPPPPSPPLQVVPPFYRQVLAVLYQTRAQWFLSVTACIAYMALRHALDWLSIPTGLIRPAENPFFDLQGIDRVVNYAYITAVHVLKSWDVDVIGFSHEYGHACIPPLQSMRDDDDSRFLLFVGVVAILLLIGLYFIVTTLLWRKRQQCRGENVILSTGCVLYLVHLSWMLTLFPITGIVKVGTFVADRIVVPSTISFTLVMAYVLTFWLDFSRCYKSYYHLPNRFKWILVVGLVVPLSWHRVHVRTLQWMDSLPLLESSLRTCPNSAKSHLEISKIYSGLYPHYLDLDQARWHLRRVQEIDADYCDVHQQLAHVAIQEQQQQPGRRSVASVLEFEEELLQALLCQFTMGSAMGLWKQYWDQTLNHNRHAAASSPDRQKAQEQAQERYSKYIKTIHEAIAKADREEQERAEAAAKSAKKKNKSPFAWGSSRDDGL